MKLREPFTGIAIAIAVALLLACASADAHPGGLAKDGAHRDSSTGERHWHLEVPCVSTPCNTGMLPAELADHLDPVPEGCADLHERIVAEANEGYWGRDDTDIAGWVLRGLDLGCWRVPRAPPPGVRR